MPGIGAFIATYRAAHIGGEAESITPPERSICFNASITNDDGLITSSIARREQISFESAREKTEQGCALLMQTLVQTGSLQIAAIGTLHIGAEKNIRFVPNPDYVCGEYWGFHPISMPTLAQLQADTLGNIQKASESLKRDPRFYYFKVRKNMVKAAACACAAFAICSSIFWIMPDDRQAIDKASLLPAKVQIPTHTDKAPVKSVNVDTLPTLQTSAKAETDKQPQSVDTAPESGMYYLIVASTPDKAEMDRFMLHNNDDKRLQIVSTRTMKRAYTAKSANREELVAMINDPALQSRYKMPWIWQAK